MLYSLAHAIERVADWDRYVLTPAVLRFLCFRHFWRDDFQFWQVYQTQTCRVCKTSRRVSETPLPEYYQLLLSIRRDDRLTRP